MALDRVVPTTGAFTSFVSDLNTELVGLWNNSAIFLTSVSGTNTITATASPAFTGYATGMSFYLRPAVNNTGAVTININSQGAKSVVQVDGSALVSGAIETTALYQLVYDGTNFVVMGTEINNRVVDYQVFTTTGANTWNKPTGASSSALVLIECWGAGGGGANTAGTGGSAGGGGSYERRIMRLSQLSATETATVGAGGAVGSAGGNTTFGSHVTAYGGGQGFVGTNGGGGGGGGQGGAGASGTSASGGGNGGGIGGVTFSLRTTLGEAFAGSYGGGYGGNGGAGSTTVTHGGSSIYGGGGGGGAENASGRNGGSSVYGGGGGGGGSSGTGGSSTYGGAGGSDGAAGTAPAGGGGRNAAGARGEIRVLVIG